MPPQPLSNGQQAQLNLASRVGVITAVSRLRQYLSYDRWIGDNNIYWSTPTRALRDPSKSGQNLNTKHIAEYVAASSPLHCADGWGFLGRAIHCHALGDFHQARHLAYYAELRGAMSLLASEGIGVFDNSHIVVDHSANCIQIPAHRTHVFTWLALEHWAGRASASNLFEQIIRPDGIQLEDWIREFGAKPQAGVVVKDWLIKWGLDLKQFSEDRDARNESSYRPGNLRFPSDLDVSFVQGFIIDIWRSYQPDTPSAFGIIDRHLLRIGLEVSYRAAFGTRANLGLPRYSQRVAAMIGRLPVSAQLTPLLTDFLLRQREPEDLQLVTYARGTDDPSDSKHHMQVIARAALLLRIATGASNSILKEAGLTYSDMSFWVNGIGERRGIWGQRNKPTNITDLWADVDQAIGDLIQWEAGQSRLGTVPEPVDWLANCAGEITELGKCERIALWGITP